ncbi:hypothetical protein [Streptomyces sp. NBC_00102]|uniref:hypothetical protein n=1 Tax=Streptomyces sp. NBC_00102 TaxID=2975652 RepID=UPI002250AEA5|nr:hypothetical protein [Streptomyces sp. NBC_00102]MCX5400991.1 hypothetical protein [Streptomyces sp. NBC_00102]
MTRLRTPESVRGDAMPAGTPSLRPPRAGRPTPLPRWGRGASAARPRARRAAAALPWAALSAVLVLLCCSLGASAAAGTVEGGAVGNAPAGTTARATLTLVHPAEVPEVQDVRAYAPAGHGPDSSCHGSPGCAAAALPPALASPVALPHPDGIGPLAPSPGVTPIRGPSDTATQAVDRLRLGVQRT